MNFNLLYTVLGVRIVSASCFVSGCFASTRTHLYSSLAYRVYALWGVSCSIPCSIYFEIGLYGVGEYSLVTFVDDSCHLVVLFVPLACLLACPPACRCRARPWGPLANLVGASGLHQAIISGMCITAAQNTQLKRSKMLQNKGKPCVYIKNPVYINRVFGRKPCLYKPGFWYNSSFITKVWNFAFVKRVNSFGY